MVSLFYIALFLKTQVDIQDPDIQLSYAWTLNHNWDDKLTELCKGRLVVKLGPLLEEQHPEVGHIVIKDASAASSTEPVHPRTPAKPKCKAKAKAAVISESEDEMETPEKTTERTQQLPTQEEAPAVQGTKN